MDLLESDIKRMKSDMILIENDYYHKMDRLMKKKLPKEEKDGESSTNEPEILNSTGPLKFI